MNGAYCSVDNRNPPTFAAAACMAGRPEDTAVAGALEMNLNCELVRSRSWVLC